MIQHDYGSKSRLMFHVSEKSFTNNSFELAQAIIRAPKALTGSADKDS